MGTQAMMARGMAPQPGGVLLGNVAYMPPGLEGYYKEPFSYNIVFNAIAAGAVSTASTNIQNDAFFVCTQQMADIWDSATGGTTQFLPRSFPGLVRVFDTSSGKAGMDVATPFSSQFGTASEPKVWLYRAKIYMPGGQISAEVTNKTPATSVTVRLVFEGFKVYRLPDELVNMNT